MLETQTGKQKIETEESLRNSRELFKKFASHLQALREEEKGNLSRELHDSIGQSLTGLKIYAHRILHSLNVGLTNAQVDSLREQVTEMIGIIDGSLKGVKKIVRDIRPRILDEFGLVPAIEIFIKEFTASRGLQYELIKETRKIEINKVSSLEVYRIIQEIFSYVICQSNTTMLTVKISDKKHMYVIGILDDASGQNETDFFELNSIRIVGLDERVKVFGGNLHFSVDESSGVKIVISIPKNEIK
jgi:two-component system sensor histidine kinase UhpB